MGELDAVDVVDDAQQQRAGPLEVECVLAAERGLLAESLLDGHPHHPLGKEVDIF